jgi:hypothetical protein
MLVSNVCKIGSQALQQCGCGGDKEFIFVCLGEEDDGDEERGALHCVGQARQRAERSHPQDHQGEDPPGFAQVATFQDQCLKKNPCLLTGVADP